MLYIFSEHNAIKIEKSVKNDRLFYRKKFIECTCIHVYIYTRMCNQNNDTGKILIALIEKNFSWRKFIEKKGRV